MRQLTRSSRDPRTKGGKPCILGMRVTVGTFVGLVAAGHTHEKIPGEYPDLETDVIAQALSHTSRPKGRHAPAIQRPMVGSEP
jgi:uncharacterized protein (DUF433 family)